MHTKRVLAAAALSMLFAACGGSGLGGGEWVWCKENPTAVDAAATSLNIATAQRTFQEPTWWQDYLAMVASQNNSGLMANADFAPSCTAAEVKAGVDTANIAWCTAEGIGETWDAAITLGLMTDVDADTFAYRALPLQQRINDADFDRACKSAYSTPAS
jgi:hypothetical protein